MSFRDEPDRLPGWAVVLLVVASIVAAWSWWTEYRTCTGRGGRLVPGAVEGRYECVAPR